MRAVSRSRRVGEALGLPSRRRDPVETVTWLTKDDVSIWTPSPAEHVLRFTDHDGAAACKWHLPQLSLGMEGQRLRVRGEELVFAFA